MLTIENRNWKQAAWRGFNKCCPACGHGPLFKSYIGVNPTCPACDEPLHHQRADDAPPYFTITMVGHIVIPALLLVEKVWRPEMWVHFTLWLPITLLLTLWLLPRVKGAIVGLQWALRMHGFGGPDENEDQPLIT